MELTLENLVNEIVDKECVYHTCMINSGNFFGEDSDEFKKWKVRWKEVYNLALKFGFTDKLNK